MKVTTVCVKDRGLQSQKYRYHNFFACLVSWLDFSHVEIWGKKGAKEPIKKRHAHTPSQRDRHLLLI